MQITGKLGLYAWITIRLKSIMIFLCIIDVNSLFLHQKLNSVFLFYNRYVSKAVDELTKNHRSSDQEKVTGFMPEAPGNPMCPVASFERYILKLNPKCDRLWQHPLGSYQDKDMVCQQTSWPQLPPEIYERPEH